MGTDSILHCSSNPLRPYRALGKPSYAPETIPLQENIPGDLDRKCLQLYSWGGHNHPPVSLMDGKKKELDRNPILSNRVIL